MKTVTIKYRNSVAIYEDVVLLLIDCDNIELSQRGTSSPLFSGGDECFNLKGYSYKIIIENESEE